MKARLQALWWQAGATPPLPLRWAAQAYAAVADTRAARLRAAQLRLPVPVIVVGNVAVGGTGKTPVVLWLLDALRALGATPGVISRGYGGRGPFPLAVTAATDPTAAGDEPVLLARRAGVPVWVAPDRVAAGRALLAAHPEVDVLVCDDGLQHYRLARDAELGVVDASPGRGHGNGWRLPAGPLREPAARLERCDRILVNGGDAAPFGPGALRFDLVPGPLRAIASTTAMPQLPFGAGDDVGPDRTPSSDSTTAIAESAPLDDLNAAFSVARKSEGEGAPPAGSALAAFAGRRVHAVAGIGNPQRFFASLRAAGIEPLEHAFADHHDYVPADLDFAEPLPVLMTEKDAVKCERLPLPAGEHWAVPVALRFADPAAEAGLRDWLAGVLTARTAGTVEARSGRAGRAAVQP